MCAFLRYAFRELLDTACSSSLNIQSSPSHPQLLPPTHPPPTYTPVPPLTRSPSPSPSPAPLARPPTKPSFGIKLQTMCIWFSGDRLVVVGLFFLWDGGGGGGRGWDLRGWSHGVRGLVRVLLMSIGWGGRGWGCKRGFKALGSA